MDIQAAYRGHSTLAKATVVCYPFTLYCTLCSANVARLPGNRCDTCTELATRFKSRRFLPIKLDGCPAKRQSHFIDPCKIKIRL